MMLKMLRNVIVNKGSITFDDADRMSVSGPTEAGLNGAAKKGMGEPVG